MYTGLTGALKINRIAELESIGEPGPVAYISGWSIEEKTEMMETSKISRINKGSFPGIQSWSASADGAVTFEGDGQKELFLAKYAGKKVAIFFYLNDSSISGAGSENTYFYGEGYIESLSVNLSAEDKGNISISIAGDGPLDLYINDKNVRTGTDRKNAILKMYVKEDGDLWVNVPDGMEDIAYIDADGRFIIKI